MSKGKAIVEMVRGPGLVGHENAGEWDYIYRVSLIKDEKYDIGDRAVLPDGREYRYAKSIGICRAAQGCEFTYTGYSGYTAADVAQAIGDRQVSISASATHAIIAKDALKGGYVVLHNSVLAVNAQTQVRGIIGNDAVAVADSGCVLYLDGALTTAVVIGTTGVEVFENPYAALQLCQTPNVACAGVPASYVSATLMFFWVQIKGPCFVAPQSSVNTNDVGCGFRGDGSLDGYNHLIANDINGVAEETSQYAGYSILGNQAGNGPLFMLQC